MVHGSLPENMAISQLFTNIAVAAIENRLLTVDLPLGNGDFPYPWQFTSGYLSMSQLFHTVHCLVDKHSRSKWFVGNCFPLAVENILFSILYGKKIKIKSKRPPGQIGQRE